MKYKYKGVIFDLDGTLVDTLEDIAASMNRALEMKGFPPHPAGAYMEKVGWGIKQLALLSLPEDVQKDRGKADELAVQLSSESASYYAGNPVKLSKIYPGIEEVLSFLRQKKIKLSVLTNKPDPVAQKVIKALFPPGSFDIIRGEIMGGSRKPDPQCVWDILVELDLNPADTIFIGDSEIDMETAVNAGCFPLGADWGYRSREILLEGGAKKIISKPEELLEFFI